VEGSGLELSAYAVVPLHARRGVVVLHEILGRRPEIERVVDRFAMAGYAGVLPDLFAGGSRIVCVRNLMRACATGSGPPVELVLAARRWLCGQAELAPAQVGLIGFCITGGFVLAMGRGWGAVSANYGAVPKPELMQGIAPVIACYGERDRIFGHLGKRLRDTLSSLHVDAEVHSFPTVGHSFLTDGDHPVLEWFSRPFLHARYDPSIADDAWRRILSFFERHL